MKLSDLAGIFQPERFETADPFLPKRPIVFAIFLKNAPWRAIDFAAYTRPFWIVLVPAFVQSFTGQGQKQTVHPKSFRYPFRPIHHIRRTTAFHIFRASKYSTLS